MSVVFRIGEEEPLFHLGEFPVRLITLLVALHSATMIAVSILLATGHGALIDLLAYSGSAVSHGQLWRLVTYAFVATPSVWFLLEMLMLWYFGKEVENGLGWKRFAILYAGLILIGPMLLQAFAYAGRPQSFAGAQEINFAIFAAFTAMHPGARFFFGVAARWVFLGLLAISVLQLLADQQVAQDRRPAARPPRSPFSCCAKRASPSRCWEDTSTWKLPWGKSSSPFFPSRTAASPPATAPPGTHPLRKPAATPSIPNSRWTSCWRRSPATGSTASTPPSVTRSRKPAAP